MNKFQIFSKALVRLLPATPLVVIAMAPAAPHFM